MRKLFRTLKKVGHIKDTKKIDTEVGGQEEIEVDEHLSRENLITYFNNTCSLLSKDSVRE